MCQDAVSRLNKHQSDIENSGDREGGSERGRRMAVAMVVAVLVAMMMTMVMLRDATTCFQLLISCAHVRAFSYPQETRAMRLVRGMK